MPFPRRGGRRRPFINSRWQIRRIEALCLFLSPSVRSTLTAWMKIYGETNEVPGLISGPIEVRFRRLREHPAPTSSCSGRPLSAGPPARRSRSGSRPSGWPWMPLRRRAPRRRQGAPTTQEERDPCRQRSAIGIELRPDSIELPTDATDENPSAGLVAAFERLLDRRWTSFVDPLREALEAEARDDAARAERLATPYAVATRRIGSQSESIRTACPASRRPPSPPSTRASGWTWWTPRQGDLLRAPGPHRPGRGRHGRGCPGGRSAL